MLGHGVDRLDSVAFFSDVFMQMVSNMDVSSYLVVSLACVGFEDNIEFIAFIYSFAVVFINGAKWGKDYYG